MIITNNVLLRATSLRPSLFCAISLKPSQRFQSEDAQAAPTPAQEPLVDLLGRRHDYLRISLTERCNLRCQYCMPAGGVALTPRDALLSRAELSRVCVVFAALGVSRVRLTGGEPTLRADLVEIVEELSGVFGDVGMTTNGVALLRRLPALARAGLGRVNVSLDSLRPERYERMARRPGLNKVLAGIDLALQLGYSPVKINIVLMKGFNDDEIGDFVEMTRDRDLEVRFIEFMPFSGNAWEAHALVPHRAALRLAARTHELQPAPQRPHDTARLWKVPGYTGTVGFISSMTHNFCSSCNRLRLTADGNLKVCLFDAGEVSLRDAMRSGSSDAALADLIRAALRDKRARHAAGARLMPDCCRDAEPQADAEPAHDPHRRVARGAARPGGWGGRNALSLPHLDESGHAHKVDAWVAKGAGLALPGMWGELKRSAVGANARSLCSLPHLDGSGHARMVDVGDKPITVRTAEAQCTVHAAPCVLEALRARRVRKGDALAVARVAGVMAAKRTADVLPLCHPLPLDHVRVSVDLPQDSGPILVSCAVRTTARTGAEMEALTGAAVAALALYDMCKALDRGINVTDLHLVSKAGGRSGNYERKTKQDGDSAVKDGRAREHDGDGKSDVQVKQKDVKVRDHDKSPLRPSETYVPTNFINF